MGVILFDTPHFRAGLAEWALVSAKAYGIKCERTTQRQKWTSLKDQTTSISDMQRRFRDIDKIEDEDVCITRIEVICCFATSPVPANNLMIAPEWAILPRRSAVAIPADHFGVTKCTPKTRPKLEMIITQVSQWIGDLDNTLLSVIESRTRLFDFLEIETKSDSNSKAGPKSKERRISEQLRPEIPLWEDPTLHPPGDFSLSSTHRLLDVGNVIVRTPSHYHDSRSWLVKVDDKAGDAKGIELETEDVLRPSQLREASWPMRQRLEILTAWLSYVNGQHYFPPQSSDRYHFETMKKTGCTLDNHYLFRARFSAICHMLLGLSNPQLQRQLYGESYGNILDSDTNEKVRKVRKTFSDICSRSNNEDWGAGVPEELLDTANQLKEIFQEIEPRVETASRPGRALIEEVKRLLRRLTSASKSQESGGFAQEVETVKAYVVIEAFDAVGVPRDDEDGVHRDTPGRHGDKARFALRVREL